MLRRQFIKILIGLLALVFGCSEHCSVPGIVNPTSHPRINFLVYEKIGSCLYNPDALARIRFA